MYLDPKTNTKYILNKVDHYDWAFVKEYPHDTLQEEDMFIIPYEREEKEIYAQNPHSIGAWRIESGYGCQNCLATWNIP